MYMKYIKIIISRYHTKSIYHMLWSYSSSSWQPLHGIHE